MCTSCFQMTRNEQARTTEETDQYRERTWQEVAYNTVTKPDGSMLKTPVILTLQESEHITTDKQIMEKRMDDRRTSVPTGNLIGKALGAAGIPGGGLIGKFLDGMSKPEGGGLTGMGGTNEILMLAGTAWAAERKMASNRRAPVPNPQPIPPEGRVNGNTGLREENV